MGLLGTIVRKELLQGLLTFRFAAALVMMAALWGSSLWTASGMGNADHLGRRATAEPARVELEAVADGRAGGSGVADGLGVRGFWAGDMGISEDVVRAGIKMWNWGNILRTVRIQWATKGSGTIQPY